MGLKKRFIKMARLYFKANPNNKVLDYFHDPELIRDCELCKIGDFNIKPFWPWGELLIHVHSKGCFLSGINEVSHRVINQTRVSRDNKTKLINKLGT